MSGEGMIASAPAMPHMDALLVRLERLEELLGLVGRPIVPPPYFPRHVTMAEIVIAVSFETGVSTARIQGESRSMDVFRARAAVCWLARALTGKSLQQIGIALGGRDHTTILSAHRRSTALIARDPAFRMLTTRLYAHFRGIIDQEIAA